MSDVTLDSNIFFDRAKKIFDAWEVSQLAFRLSNS